MATRQELREKIFSEANSKPKSEVITFFGEQIEIRQPPVGAILDMRSVDSLDTKERMIRMIVEYAVVPGTDEKVFDTADVEQFLSMPYGPDFNAVSQAIGRLTDLDLEVKDAAKK